MRAALLLAVIAVAATAGDGQERSFDEALRAGDLEVTVAMLPQLVDAADQEADPALRDAAIGALRRLGPDAMSRHLKEDPSASQEVYRGLALAGPEGQKALVAWLDANHWPDRAILALGGCDGEVVVPLLLAKTASEDPFVRGYALQALAHFEVERALEAPVLRRCLADPVPHVRRCALAAAQPFLEAYRDASFVPLLRERLWEDDEEICRLAACALAMLGSAAAPAAAELAGIAKQGPARYQALEALRAIGPAAAPGARYALTEMLTGDADQEQRLAVACALATIAPEERKALTVLVDVLAEKDEWGFAADLAVRALIGMGSAAAPELPRLRRMLEEDDPALAVRAATVVMSASGRPEEGLPTLLAYLERWMNDDAPGVDTALLAIGDLGAKARAAAPRLRKLLAHADPCRRIEVARALWRVTGDAKDVLPAMHASLAPGTDDHLVFLAIGLAREIGPPARDLLPRLRELARSDSAMIRHWAEMVIPVIDGG